MPDGTALSRRVDEQLTWCAGTGTPQRSASARGLGVDVVDVPRVRLLAGRRDGRALARLFTAEERTLCEGRSEQHRNYRMAGRIAAKEAVKKTLGPHGTGVGWLDVEIRRGSVGEPLLVLHRAAREAASRAEFSTVRLSITHEADIAVAVALAV